MVQLSVEAAEKLNSLLGEINFLATQWKQARPLFPEQGELAGGMRGVLTVLGRHGGRTVPEIARARRTSRQNIQIVVNRLRSQGLAELETNPTHKKSSLVRLTLKGQSLFEQIDQAEAKFLTAVLNDLSSDELAETTSCLQKLRQVLETETTNQNGHAYPVSQQPKSTVKSRLSPRQTRQSDSTVSSHKNGEAPSPPEEDFPVNLL